MNTSNVNCGFGSLSIILKNGIKNYYLQEDEIKIGSSDEADIRYGNVPGLESIHCTIIVERNGKATIFNMSKSNPIKVNDEIVEKSHRLQNGDTVDMMGKIFKYNSNDVQKTPKTKNVRLVQSESKYGNPKPATRSSLSSIKKKPETRIPNFSGGTKSFLKNRGKLPGSLIPVRAASKSLFQGSAGKQAKISLPASMSLGIRTPSKSNTSKLSLKENPSTVENMECTEVDEEAPPTDQSTTQSLSKLSTKVNHSTIGNLENTEFEELLNQTAAPNESVVYNFKTSTAKKGAQSFREAEEITDLIDLEGTLKTPVPTKRFSSRRSSKSLLLDHLPSPIKPLRSKNNSAVEGNSTLMSENDYETAAESAVTTPYINKSRKSTMSSKKSLPADDSSSLYEELPSPIAPEGPVLANLALETPVFSRRCSLRASKSNYSHISDSTCDLTVEEKTMENVKSSESISIVSLHDTTQESNDSTMQSCSSTSSNASEDPIVLSIKDSTEESIDTSERSSNTPYRPILEDITPVSSEKASTSKLTFARLSETPKEEAGGRKNLTSTPKPPKEPLNDLSDVRGVKKLLKTPRVQREPLNDLTDLRGVKYLLATPKPLKEPRNDLTDVSGVKKILATPKPLKEPRNDLTDVRGVKKILATPKPLKEPLNDLTDVKGVKKLLKTPKVQREPLNDLTDVRGVKKIMATPKAPQEPLNDLTDVKGVKKLLRTPKVQNSPRNDLSDVQGVKKIMATPKPVKEPSNDLSDVRGVRQLMKTPKEEREPDYQGVADLFSKVFEKAPLKTYRGQSSPEKTETNYNISVYVDPSVENWVEKTTEATGIRKRRLRIVEEVTYYDSNKKTEPARKTRRLRKLTDDQIADESSEGPVEAKSTKKTAKKTSRKQLRTKKEPEETKEESEEPESEPTVEEQSDKSSKTKTKTSKRKKTSKEIEEPAKEEEEESVETIKKRKLSNDVEATLKEPVRSTRRNKSVTNKKVMEPTEEESLKTNKKSKTTKKNTKKDDEESAETDMKPKRRKINTKQDEEESVEIIKKSKLSNDVEDTLKEPVRSTRRNKPATNNKVMEPTEEESLKTNKKSKTTKKNTKKDEEESAETNMKPKRRKNTKQDEEESVETSKKKKTTREIKERRNQGKSSSNEASSSKENIEPIEEGREKQGKTKRKAKNAEPLKEESILPKRVLRKRNNSVNYSA
ncbi:unnamed protein product [Phyllotreta striolata]|uniref:FHA domain-containing protein n=1 Tax=Phyllotreta striolata TaxID=444603 RepID=A0A9N9TVI6_PHYSR|nr:unnamed protein product [Phyllotreta striolata]